MPDNSESAARTPEENWRDRTASFDKLTAFSI